MKTNDPRPPRGGASRQRGTPLHLAIPVVLCAMILGVLHVSGHGTARVPINQTSARTDGDTLTGGNDTLTGGNDTLVESTRAGYCYRTYCVMYDSVALCCSYGEVCLPNRDSLPITPVDMVLDPISLDPQNMALVCRTRPFFIDGGTRMSLWRGLHLQQEALLFRYAVLDTCSWVLRLHHAHGDEIIATLDSAGFYPGHITQWGEFPRMFGTSNTRRSSYGLLSYDLGAYAGLADSVYLSVGVIVHGRPDAALTLRDQTLPDRISDMMRQNR